jgi:NADH-quinone oxidoreductase subunit M
LGGGGAAVNFGVVSLSWMIILPLLGGLLVYYIADRWAKAAAMLSSLLAVLVATLALAASTDVTEVYPWLPTLNADLRLHWDGLSKGFVLLAGALSFLAMAAAQPKHSASRFFALLLLEQAAMTGTFLAGDFISFFIFFELSLLPVFFLIHLWGSERGPEAALKFLLFTIAGSVFLLAGGLLVYSQTATTNFSAWPNLLMSERWQFVAFWCLLAGFAVKIPMLPLHTWLPSAHVQAPTAASVLLAGVLLKMGGYGILRLIVPNCPAVFRHAETMYWLSLLSVVAILYAGIVCLMQHDWKRLIAYSSVSHMGFVTLGIFSYSANGLAGAAVQMINHGITAAMMFLLFGAIYDRVHSRAISNYGGAAGPMPGYARIFAFAMFASIGLPPLNGFVGEFLVLQAAFSAHRWMALAAMFGLLLSAAYLLWLYQRTMLGDTKPALENVADISGREQLVFLPLVIVAFAIGVYPKPLLKMLQPPVTQMLRLPAEQAAQR